MDADRRKRLEAAGWKIGDAQEFLGLSDEEMACIDLRIAQSDRAEDADGQAG
jgi:hypothetical protein